MTEKTIQATETSLTIVEYLEAEKEAMLSEIATKRDHAVSTVHNHFKTLRNRGFVVHENEENYLGLRFLNLGWYVRNRKPINRLAVKYTERLADETDEQAHFIVEENGRGYHDQIASSERATPIDSHPGKRSTSTPTPPARRFSPTIRARASRRNWNGGAFPLSPTARCFLRNLRRFASGAARTTAKSI